MVVVVRYWLSVVWLFLAGYVLFGICALLFVVGCRVA